MIDTSRTSRDPKGLPQLLGFLACVLCLAFIRPAYAQDEVRRTVVLDVRDGDSQALRDAVGAVESVEVEDQDWFLRQIRKLDVKAEKIMKRPKDLRFVMEESDIDYVVAVLPGDGGFEGGFYDGSGELAHQFDLSGESFDTASVDEVRAEFEEFLGIGFEMGEEVQPDEQPAESSVEVSETREKPEPTRPESTTPWLQIEPSGRMYKRDLSLVGEGGAALTFQSALYPGASVDASVFPAAAEFGDVTLGGYLGGDLGFDSLATEGASIPILHLEAAGGLGLRLQSPSDVRLRLGARHARFTLEANDALPSLTMTLLTAGIVATHSIGRIRVDGDLAVIPYGFYGESRRLFGESSRVFGFAGGLALRFGLIDSVDGTVGYRFRALRSRFPGDGALEFRETIGFELVQGPRVGITLHY